LVVGDQLHEDADADQGGASWSLTSLREKLIKIGAKVVSHGRYVTFQMAEVAVPRQMFQEILSLIDRLRAPPARAREERWGGCATGGGDRGVP
jgi:hypothetical protein